MDNYELLNKTFQVSPSIRYVGIFDAHGEKITDSFSPGTLQHLNIEEMHDSTRYDIKRWETYKKFQKQLGETNFSMVKFDKAILLTFPHSNGAHIRVSIEPDTDYKEIIAKIENLLNRYPGSK